MLHFLVTRRGSLIWRGEKFSPLSPLGLSEISMTTWTWHLVQSTPPSWPHSTAACWYLKTVTVSWWLGAPPGQYRLTKLLRTLHAESESRQDGTVYFLICSKWHFDNYQTKDPIWGQEIRLFLVSLKSLLTTNIQEGPGPTSVKIPVQSSFTQQGSVFKWETCKCWADEIF